MRLNSFDEVANRYANVKPVISKNFTVDDDMRPIANRRRPYERIKKWDSNTYLLTDSEFFGMTTTRVSEEVKKFEAHIAPIVWTREDGHDYIRVRLVPEWSYLSPVRMRFLYDYLPNGIHLSANSRLSKLVVATAVVPGSGGMLFVRGDFILPKYTAEFDHKQNTYTTDELFLKFRRNGDGTWTRVSKPMEIRTFKVDTELKKQLKPQIEGFYATCCLYRDMLRNHKRGWTVHRENFDAIVNWAQENKGIQIRSGWYNPRIKDLPPEIVKEIISDEQHPVRIELVSMAIFEADLSGNIETQEVASAKRAAFNRLMNQALDLRKTEAV